MINAESWRLSRGELEGLANTYERLVADDFKPLLNPTKLERFLLGNEVLIERLRLIRTAAEANRKFVEALRDDLPEDCPEEERRLEGPRARPVAAIRRMERDPKFLPSISYGSLSALLLHLMRDWSDHHEHVRVSTYGPVLDALRTALPAGGDVLLPGAGLGRLALEIVAAGYRVEANDASRLFLTAADYILNRAPPDALRIFPLAHLFEENWSLANQYLELRVPAPAPASVASSAASPAASDAEATSVTGGAGEVVGSSAVSSRDPRCFPDGTSPPLLLVPGDFTTIYAPMRGECHRKFNAVVTCFFMDTLLDLAEFVALVESLLPVGGVWVNIGPLHFNKDAKLKLCWEEIACMFERAGFEFASQQQVQCDYHLPFGFKMFSESYGCVLSTAIKKEG